MTTASQRFARVTRETKETSISIKLSLDGSGNAEIDTGVPFLDHMLDAFARHGFVDLYVEAQGDTDIDDHHTVEDIGIVLGQAFHEALGDMKGIKRYGDCALPMDEALVLAAVDISGRGMSTVSLGRLASRVGSFDTELVAEFLHAFASNARITLHVVQLQGENTHHILEATFKAIARALDQATQRDPRVEGVPSTKGSL